MAKKNTNDLVISVSGLLGDPVVSAMPAEAQGLYLLLLLRIWDSDAKVFIPDSDEFISRLLNISIDRWQSARAAIMPKLRSENGCLISDYLVARMNHKSRGGGAKSDGDTGDALRLAERLRSRIKDRYAAFKDPDIKKWAAVVDLMIRADGRNPDDIAAVIDWSQQDDLWKNNILSTAKLRKQFDQLYLKMTSVMKGAKNHGQRRIDANRGAEPFRWRIDCQG